MNDLELTQPAKPVKPCRKCGAVERDKRGNCGPCGREAVKRWRDANRDKHLETKKHYREANREAQRAHNKRWREARPEAFKDGVRRWRQDNHEAHLKAKQRYREANPEAIRVHSHNRRARVKASGGKLSPDIAQRLFTAQKGKCACCKTKMESYHIDHIMPLALGGLNVDNNVQLLCPPCNLSKGAKHPVDFAQERGLLL